MKLKKKVHSVKRFSVQVEYPEVNSAKNAQDRVFSIVKNILVDKLENACNKYGSDSLIRIKSLTLDLGDIQISDIDSQLPKAFEKKINQVLSGFSSNIYSNKELDGVDVIDEEKQILIYFEYYLKYGAIPWYMQDVIGDYTFNEVFAYLIEENTDSFKTEFYNLLEYPNVRQRLLRYFDSGEIFQFFKNSLTNAVYSNIQLFRKEINQLISSSTNIENIHKGYLLNYLKEFLLVATSDSQKKNQSLTLDLLTKKYIDFITKDKNISPENWLPSVFANNLSSTQVDSTVNEIILALQEYYTNYLFTDKSKLTGTKIDTLEGKIQFEQWLIEMQPIAGRFLSKAIDELIKYITKSFSSTDKTKIEQIVWDIAAGIIPNIPIAQENISKWVYAITQQAQEKFGISTKHILIETIQSSEGKDGIDLTTEKDFNISIAREYLSLFLKSSLTPFKKLFHDPSSELTELFSRYLREDSGAKAFIKSQVDDTNLMALWWVKNHLGDTLFKEFKQIIRDGRQDIIPDIVDYNYLLLVSFIRTGTVSWAELIDKGKEKVVKILEQYFKKDRKEILIKVLLDEDFFKKKDVMGKVFDTLSLEPAKELLQIRKELITKGEIIISDVELTDESKKSALSKKGKTERSDSEIVLDSERIVDGLANYILDFGKGKHPLGVSSKNQANLIFDEILKSVRRSLYETAAMLTSIDKKIVDVLLVAFDVNQRDYVKKIIQNYRTRFFNIAEEIKESEQLHIPIQDGEAGETFYVNNAGLVLLSVYVKRLFNRFELLDKKEFKSDEAREKAIYLLQYLVAKDDNPGEHELALNKILVGMPLGYPMKYGIKLTNDEKEICEGLLEAVIKNWTVLKNTSNDGLRTSFLLRKGSLNKDENGWKLRVEKKTFDILLSKLPWGYTMIHLPWMQFPVLTEWEE